MTILAVTGSRKWPPTAHAMGVIFRYIDYYIELSWDAPELWHGECPEGGVDAYAAAYAYGAGYGVRGFPPVPSDGRTQLYPRDFAIRNQKMIDAGPDILVAFFMPGEKNAGTQMTLDMAKRAGIATKEVLYEYE